MNPNADAPPIIVRKPGFEFGDDIPRWWFLDNPIVTHVANGLHLVFPEGERFFIRSVNTFLPQIEDPALAERVRNFFAQESRHGLEHQHSFEMLERQGYDVEGFLEPYRTRWLPRLEQAAPRIWSLSVTVALEHLTATLGESALVEDYLDAAHPTMRSLLRWHAAEEIEHKSVAFDVMKAVNPSYVLRIFGMLVALIGLLGFWRVSARHMLRQEPQLSRQDKRRYFAQARAWRRGQTAKLLWRAVGEYLNPRFHPNQRDNYQLAVNYFAQWERAAG